MYGAENIVVNVCLLLMAGLLVNGPYALITTAVSAELGTHHSLHGNSKALATVTAIIDGTGSIGNTSLYLVYLQLLVLVHFFLSLDTGYLFRK